MFLRIKFRREIKLALIDDGNSQAEIANELSDLAEKQYSRVSYDPWISWKTGFSFGLLHSTMKILLTYIFKYID